MSYTPAGEPAGGQTLSEDVVRNNLEKICSEYHDWKLKTTEYHPYNPSTCKATLLPGDQYSGDFGGDMNHVHRVGVTLSCGATDTLGRHDHTSVEDEEMTVVVKIAPQEVRFLKEECGEDMSVDPNKIKAEYDALRKFEVLQPLSVPHLYVLDPQHKAIIMEDLVGYRKLQDQLTDGRMEESMHAVEGALRLLGRVHRSTCLKEMSCTERKRFSDQFNNQAMKHLMSQFLFDKPFDSMNKSNRCNPKLSADIDSCRSDPEILVRVAQLQQSFLQQDDCLCHGDFACDNILVMGGEFRVVDLEFAGVGLRAYDVGLFLETVIFQLLCHHYSGRVDRVHSLHRMLHRAITCYEEEVGEKKGRDPTFVAQVCGLIGCEEMWKVFGSYNIEEFSGQPEPERKLLSLAKSFLLQCDGSKTLAWNIDNILSKHGYLG